MLSQLSKQYGSTVRERLVAIPDSVHDRIKDFCEKTDTKIYEAYTEAGRLWLRSKGVASEVGEIGPVSSDEEQLLSDVLALHRARRTSRQADATISSIRLLIRASKSGSLD